jgi:hypothetical protein
MTPISDAIEQARAALSTLAGVDRAALCDRDLVALLRADEELGRLGDVGRVLDAAEVADRSRYELGDGGLSMQCGERKPELFIEELTRASRTEVQRRIRIGSQIRPRVSMMGEILSAEHPLVAEAMVAGLIGMDAAHAILWSLKQASTGREATPDNMDAAEFALVELGKIECTDLVSEAGRQWRDALDPDGIEPRYEEIRERRGFTRGRERNGLTHWSVTSDPLTTAVIQAVLTDSMDRKAGPRFLSDEDLAVAATELVDVDGQVIEKILDPRTLGQKQLDILHGVLTAGLRATRQVDPNSGSTNLRTIGSVTAIVSLSDLRSGKGFGILEGIDEVIAAVAIQELACDTGFTLIATDRAGLPLYESRLLRSFTQPQRRAMVARDGDRCVVSGCRCRAATTHAHHVVFWSEGGLTDIDNGVLLCPAHHHALHQGAFEIRMVDGIPWMRAGIDSWDDSAWRPAGRNRLQPAAV